MLAVMPIGRSGVASSVHQRGEAQSRYQQRESRAGLMRPRRFEISARRDMDRTDLDRLLLRFGSQETAWNLKPAVWFVRLTVAHPHRSSNCRCLGCLGD
jgi:hypothetical protein